MASALSKSYGGVSDIIKIESCVRRLEAERVASRALVSWMWSLCEGVAERSGGADGAERRDDAAGAAERPMEGAAFLLTYDDDALAGTR